MGLRLLPHVIDLKNNNETSDKVEIFTKVKNFPLEFKHFVEISSIFMNIMDILQLHRKEISFSLHIEISKYR